MFWRKTLCWDFVVLSPVVASLGHVNMFGGFLAKAGKTAFELFSVSTGKITN